VAVDGVEEKREAETENSSGKECRENSDLLPPYLNPWIYKEADSQHNECNEACTQHRHSIIVIVKLCLKSSPVLFL